MNLAEKVRQAGVVGAGGGGFPTHVKLSAKAEGVIANGADRSPAVLDRSGGRTWPLWMGISSR